MLQATLARMGVQHNTLADFLYIADNAFVNRPSPRLEVPRASNQQNISLRS
jgi:hypothetical protein